MEASTILLANLLLFPLSYSLCPRFSWDALFGGFQSTDEQYLTGTGRIYRGRNVAIVIGQAVKFDRFSCFGFFLSISCFFFLLDYKIIENIIIILRTSNNQRKYDTEREKYPAILTSEISVLTTWCNSSQLVHQHRVTGGNQPGKAQRMRDSRQRESVHC